MGKPVSVSRWGGGLLALFATTAAFAHDLWIEPSAFRAPVGSAVSLFLRIGSGGLAESFPRVGSQLIRFEASSGSDKAASIPGLEGGDPAGFLRAGAPGLWTIAYESRPSFVELPAAKFEEYLNEEGLDAIARSRRQRGEQMAPGTELFSRSIKSLLRVGTTGVGAPSRDRAIGLPLELIAEGDLGARVPAEPLRLRLLWRGEPLGGALVDLRRLDGATDGRRAAGGFVVGPATSRRTDREGRVAFDAGPGVWLAAVVHMEASTDPRAAWRSVFGTLTLELGGAAEPIWGP